MTVVTIDLPDSVISAIVQQAARIAAQETVDSRSPWLTRREAADYLRLPLSRLEKDRSIPSHRDRGRVLYHRNELDSHFLSLDPCGRE